MRWWLSILGSVVVAMPAVLPAQDGPITVSGDTGSIRAVVARLDLDDYKATIKGLTAFGDRRQGTDRNRAAIDWIEAQLKSYGCANTERITTNTPAGSAQRFHRPGGRPRAARRRGGGRRRARHRSRRRARSPIRSRVRRGPTGVNIESELQPDTAIRADRRAAATCRVRARRSTAPRSARPIPTRCTSSAGTWTAMASARRPTTTARAPPW